MNQDRNQPAIRVMLVEDHLVVRQGLRALLEADGRARVVAEAATGSEAAALFPSTECDAVLMDVHLPDCDGMGCLREVVSLRPGLPVVMLTMQNDRETVEAALRQGARGFLPKVASIDEIFEALRTVRHGGTYLHPSIVACLIQDPPTAARPGEQLTQRERDVLSRVVRGLTNAQIGQELFLAESTVKTHLRSLYSKLQVATRSELVYRTMTENLLRDPA